MPRIISAIAVAAFCLSGTPASAQLGAVTEGAKKVGEATSEAGKATADTAKDAAKAVEKGTKKAAGATKDAVQSSFVCADGTTDQATLKSNACKGHGGVKAESAKPKR
jgi:hypothetical protein